VELIRLIRMCLKETYTNISIGKNVSDVFPIQNGLEQGNA